MKLIQKPLVLFSIIFLLFFSPSLHAQVGDPGCDPECNCRSDGSYCPIDNGVWILLSVGVLYGLKKIKSARSHATPAS